MKNRKIYFLLAGLGFLITAGTFISLVLDLSFWNIPPLMILLITCFCLLGLMMTKPGVTVLKVFLLIGLGLSAVIHIMSIIHGS